MLVITIRRVKYNTKDLHPFIRMSIGKLCHLEFSEGASGMDLTLLSVQCKLALTRPTTEIKLVCTEQKATYKCHRYPFCVFQEDLIGWHLHVASNENNMRVTN